MAANTLSTNARYVLVGNPHLSRIVRAFVMLVRRDLSFNGHSCRMMCEEWGCIMLGRGQALIVAFLYPYYS